MLVTRARAQASELADLVDELGGEPCEYPVIDIREPQEAAAVATLRAALSEAEQYGWLMFTSVNGVDYFYRWLRRFGIDIRRFHKARIAAVGPKTAEALENRGLTVELLPAKFQAEGLLEQLAGELQAGERVLLPRGDLAREVLPRELAAKGLLPTEIDVYETVLADTQDDQVLEWIDEKQIHMITFTSSSTVTNLLEKLRRSGISDPVQAILDIPAISIGPLTSATMKEAGLRVAAEAEQATIPSLIDAMIKYRSAERA